MEKEVKQEIIKENEENFIANLNLILKKGSKGV